MSDLVEVRAVVRVEMLERVVRGLKECCVPRLTVSRVRAIGSGVDPTGAKLAMDEGSAYSDKALVQFICATDECPEVTAVIARMARTGQRGDGIVSVHPVLDVTKIRTGECGLRALD